MKFKRTGIILCTEHYEACVKFYSDILGLPMLHRFDNEHSQLTCFGMGGDSYLMVEHGGRAVPGGKSVEDSPVRLRFNVDDVDTSAQALAALGVSVNIRREV